MGEGASFGEFESDLKCVTVVALGLGHVGSICGLLGSHPNSVLKWNVMNMFNYILKKKRGRILGDGK